MELANGLKNKLFTLNEDNENRYYTEDFDAEETKGLNNVYMLGKQVRRGSKVIDIGCGQGKFGKILKDKNCNIYGVEIDSKSSEIALSSGYYDDVFNIDITEDGKNEYLDFFKIAQNSDVVILSDILEHLVDPTKMIVNAYKLLNDNGIMLISVPNIAHIDIALNLLNDKFNYMDTGILDNTHLKFFTKTSFLDWVNQINSTFCDVNIDVKYIGATFCNNEFIKRLEKAYPYFFEILAKSENYNGLQILFKLIKIDKTQKPDNLTALISEKKIDVVDILGKALSGDAIPSGSVEIVEGERLWFIQELEKLENGIKWHNENDKNRQEYIEKLENGIKWHNENDKNRQEYIEKLENGIKWRNENDKNRQEYIEKLENGIKWHNENDKNRQEYIDKLESGIKWHMENENILRSEFEEKLEKDRELLIENRQRLFEIENSFIWKSTKFLRRNSKGRKTE